MRGKASKMVLTEQQRRLAAGNLGLVGLHLGKHVCRGRQRPAHEDRDDLFQEGAMALSRAAGTYRRRQGASFPGYALTRIRGAVNRCLKEQFATIRVPAGKLPRSASCAAAAERAAPPRCVSIETWDRGRCEFSAAAIPAFRPSAGELTVGDRVRSRIEMAARRAGQHLASRGRRLPNKAAILDRIVEDRILVPSAECRRSLREIAREFGATYSLLAYYESRLLKRMRKTLLEDPEFQRLTQQARQSSEGMDALVE